MSSHENRRDRGRGSRRRGAAPTSPGRRRLFISDAASGEIVAFTLDGQELAASTRAPRGIVGLEVGPDGHLCLINGNEQTPGHVAP